MVGTPDNGDRCRVREDPRYPIHTRSYAPTDQEGANLEQWASAALGDGVYRFTDDQLIHNIEILEAMVLSSESGAIVKVG